MCLRPPTGSFTWPAELPRGRAAPMEWLTANVTQLRRQVYSLIGFQGRRPGARGGDRFVSSSCPVGL